MSSARHIVVAVNPTAAAGKNARAGDETVRQLEAAGHAVIRVQAESAGALRDALAARTAEFDTLVVVGGDGMVSLGVNLLAATNKALAVVPAGTGNDFARGLGYEVGDLAGSVARTVAAVAHPPVRIDLALVAGAHGERLVAGVVSAGFDALVNERANRMRFPRGHSKYTIAIFRELLALRPRRYELSVDGVLGSGEAVLISVANNSYMGGGMWVSPASALSDGLLEVFRVHPVSRRRLVRLLPTVFEGKHVVEPEVEITPARSVTIDAAGVVAYGDGERIGPLPIQVDVRPQSLWLHRPN